MSSSMVQWMQQILRICNNSVVKAGEGLDLTSSRIQPDPLGLVTNPGVLPHTLKQPYGSAQS